MLNRLGHLTVQDLQLLQLIGSGVDNRPALVEASGIAERTVFRRVAMFRGAPRYEAGRVMAGCVPLVLSRKHPHQSGMQFFLTQEAEELLHEIHSLTGNREA